MIQESCRVLSVGMETEAIFVLSFESSAIARAVLPGQFVNVRAWTGCDPLLRRPFSVYHVDGPVVSILFNVVGKGTRHLSELKQGDLLDVLGPLGVPFQISGGAAGTAVLVAGGLGVAPLPLLTMHLQKLKKRVVTYLGARTKGFLAHKYLENLSVATDDGTAGFRGTVIDLLKHDLPSLAADHPVLFGCGPNAMLRALANVAEERHIHCQVSLEGPMGCGFGICQGCPVRVKRQQGSYLLMCREGPVFESSTIEI